MAESTETLSKDSALLPSVFEFLKRRCKEIVPVLTKSQLVRFDNAYIVVK